MTESDKKSFENFMKLSPSNKKMVSKYIGLVADAQCNALHDIAAVKRTEGNTADAAAR